MYDAILIDKTDNVATALREIARGSRVVVSHPWTGGSLVAGELIPAGHKLAVIDIPGGAPVIKYGETIGLAVKDIGSGSLVHIHNVEGRRGRGDLK